MWGRFAREGNPESAVFFYVLGRAAAEGSGGFGRCLQIAPSSSLPGVVACVCACGRAACLRTCFPCSPCVRTYGACVPAHVPAPVARTHARLYVRTYVHCMRAHSREGEKAPSQYVRTYARTCAYVRACPRRSLLHAVCARTYARTQFLWAPAPPPPAQRGTAPHDSHPNLFVSRPSPRTHSDRRSARRWGSSCRAPGAARTYARAYTFARALYVRTRARPVQGEMSPSRYAHPCTCVSTSARTSPSTPRYTRART